jgi:hypothetical protein
VQVAALLVLGICKTAKTNMLFRGFREEKINSRSVGEKNTTVATG